jgi:hypothetical protein
MRVADRIRPITPGGGWASPTGEKRFAIPLQAGDAMTCGGWLGF